MPSAWQAAALLQLQQLLPALIPELKPSTAGQAHYSALMVTAGAASRVWVKEDVLSSQELAGGNQGCVQCCKGRCSAVR